MADLAGARAWVVVYLKGACMGVADTVPGVSGGTIAIIVGIYERLIAALTALDPGALRYVSTLHRAEGRAAFARALLRMDVPFLVVLGTGILTAVVLVASLMNAAIGAFPAVMYGFFFGLIAASAVVLYAHVAVNTPGRIAVTIVGFLLAFLVAGTGNGAGQAPTPWLLFIAGALAISGMILPGISGALILVILGQYEFMSGIPRAMIAATISTIRTGDPAGLLDVGVPFAAFMTGAVVGLFTIAHVIKAALARYREATLAFLVSLMVGALRAPIVQVTARVPDVTATVVGLAATGALVGIVAVVLLDRYTDDLDY